MRQKAIKNATSTAFILRERSLSSYSSRQLPAVPVMDLISERQSVNLCLIIGDSRFEKEEIRIKHEFDGKVRVDLQIEKEFVISCEYSIAR